MKNAKTIRLLLILACLLAALFAFTLAANAAIVDSGTCGAEGDGSNLTWTLDDTNTLTISGTGEMRYYSSIFDKDPDWDNIAPWQKHSYSYQVKSIVIEDGVTRIGTNAFEYFSKLLNVTIPNSVTVLSNRSFFYCPSLECVTIQEGITTIGEETFSRCYNLSSITIPVSITYIGKDAFYRCKNLNDVYFNGTADEWIVINIQPGNEALTNARIRFTQLTPQPVTNVEVIKIGSNTVTLKWKPTKGATEYRIYGKTVEAQTYELLATVTETPYEIDGLSSQTTYTLVVESASVTDEKVLTADKSDPVMVTTDAIKHIPGDVDGNGKVESADARLALRASVKLENFVKGSTAFLAADVNKDGVIGSDDARHILRASVGLERFDSDSGNSEKPENNISTSDKLIQWLKQKGIKDGNDYMFKQKDNTNLFVFTYNSSESSVPFSLFICPLDTSGISYPVILTFDTDMNAKIA